jgi:integrase/recombinase XerD
MSDSSLIGSWIRRFLLEHLVAERNLSTNTQKSYRDMLTQLLPFLAAQTAKPVDRLAVGDLCAKQIRSFLRHIEVSRGCAASTRNQRLAGIHALARFIGERCPEHIEWCHQVRLIPFKKSMQPSMTCLDREEIKALLAVPTRSTPQGERDYAALLFLYNSGARASELAALTVADLDCYARTVRILGKGNKVRTCPLWPATIDVVRSLIAGRSPAERLFLNRSHQPLTRSGVHALVKRCAKRAQVSVPSIGKKKVGPHVIRHSTASHLLRAGVDLNTIRGWLGHVSIDTTNIYAEIDLDTKARALAACSVEDSHVTHRSWRKHPALMVFLHGL